MLSGKAKEKKLKRSSSGSSSKENSENKANRKKDGKKRKAASYDVRMQHGCKSRVSKNKEIHNVTFKKWRAIHNIEFSEQKILL